jgi:chromosome segregation ATPase
MSSPDPAQATPLRLVAAERLERIQREATAAVDLRTAEAAAGGTTVTTSSNRVDALHAAVVALAGKVHEVSTQTASFSDILTGRHLDYSDQVRRLTLVAEQSLAEHRQALAERDATVEKMADAVGNISRDLAGILEQVMGALRQSREVTARNEALSEQLAAGFARASQQLVDQGQQLRDELARTSAARAVAQPSAELDELRQEMRDAIGHLRDDIGTDLDGLRRLLNRNRAEGEGALGTSEELEAVRVDINSEMEALVHELHDDQVLMMREILASQKEIKKLRDELAGREPGTSTGAGMPAQLENEMSRLLIELRALRRRPFIDPRTPIESASTTPAPTPSRTPARPRARLAPTVRSQWAGRPMQGKDRSSR